MNKKTVKIVLDVIKRVSDRPGLYGAEFRSDGNHINDDTYLYFTDGYVMIRLRTGLKWGLPIAEDFWVAGDDLKRWYATAKAKDILSPEKSDADHADMKAVWDNMVGDETAEATAIDPEVFKRLAPLGHLLMSVKRKGSQKFVYFKGEEAEAVAMPLDKRTEEELRR